jgi:hypothetical protein
VSTRNFSIPLTEPYRLLGADRAWGIAGGQNKVAVTTVVHVNNFFGRVYLFFVVPAHKIIMRALLSRFAAVPRKG